MDRADCTYRKFACEREERCGWHEGSREVCLIKEEDTSTCSNADGKEEVERERLRISRASSRMHVSEKVGGHRVQSTGGGLATAEGRCDGGEKA